MEKEKKYVAGWWFWVLMLLIVSGVILTGLNYAGIFGRTVMERKVFENSFQYSEARKSEIATFEAQLAEIDRKLMNSDLDGNTKVNLEAQASALRIQLNVARNK